MRGNWLRRASPRAVIEAVGRTSWKMLSPSWAYCLVTGSNADFRGRIASLGVGRLTSINPFAGKLAAHGDRRNVGAISLSGPRCRSTSSGLAALPHAFDPLVALGVHESSQRMVTAAANPTVSDCAVCRLVCRGPIHCQGRDAGKEERGSSAGGQGPIRCVKSALILQPRVVTLPVRAALSRATDEGGYR